MCNTVPGTRENAHETRLSDYFRRKRNIPMFYLALNQKGQPIKINNYPGALKGTSALASVTKTFYFHFRTHLYQMLFFRR